MLKHCSYLFAAVLIVAVGSADAQSVIPEHRKWEISVVGGVSFLGDISGAPGIQYADGYLLGLRVSENRWRHLGFTLGYAFSNQPLTLTGLQGQASLGLSHSVHHVAYDIVLYPFDESYRLRPYGFFGPGVSIFRVGSNQAREDLGMSSPVKFAFNFGGGVKYLVLDRIAVGFEYRDAVSDIPRYALPGFNPSGRLHNSQISVAFHYQF